jgi:uncharacterized membrane protein YdbT with pleckstrin-like domain
VRPQDRNRPLALWEAAVKVILIMAILVPLTVFVAVYLARRLVGYRIKRHQITLESLELQRQIDLENRQARFEARKQMREAQKEE